MSDPRVLLHVGFHKAGSSWLEAWLTRHSQVRFSAATFGGKRFSQDHGEGLYVWDAAGNKYLDFLSSWGPLILGHAPRKVVKATRRAALNGSTFGAVTAAEVELGELITSNLEFVQKVRFVSSGTEAVMTALRLARGITPPDLDEVVADAYGLTLASLAPLLEPELP